MLEYCEFFMGALLDRVKVEKITKRFGRHVVFKDVCLEVSRGESLCLWGPNGSGKSTLLKSIAGLARPTSGKISYINGSFERRPAESRDDIGMAAPYVVLYNELTPDENLEFLARSRGMARDRDHENKMIAELFPAGLKNEPIGTFSSGMCRKICFIAALAHKPSVVLMDECTSHFDDPGREAAGRILNSFRKDSVMIIATNETFERAWCDRLYELRV